MSQTLSKYNFLLIFLGGLGSVRKKRQVQTKYRMPLFNWQSLQENKIKGTIFGDIDDEKLYDVKKRIHKVKHFKHTMILHV